MANEEPGKTPTIYEIVLIMLEQIGSVSWQKLGLQPDPFTGTITPNLKEARAAIDLTAHLSKILEDQLDDEDRRRVQSLVRDLRLNYVSKSSEAEK